MIELLWEDDYNELPDEAAHKWLHLQKIARIRLEKNLEGATAEQQDQFKLHFMQLMQTLADVFEVPNMSIPNGTSVQRTFEAFQLQITAAQARILATSLPTFPQGRIALRESSKKTILSLTAQLEIHVNELDISEYNRNSLHKCLEDFRREINQPRSRAGVALSKLTTVVAFVGATVGAEVIGDIYDKITSEIGVALIAETDPEIAQIAADKLLRLPSPPKLIEDHSGESSK